MTELIIFGRDSGCLQHLKTFSALSRMQFRGACAALMQSERLLKQSSTESFSGPREELQTTLRALKCQ